MKDFDESIFWGIRIRVRCELIGISTSVRSRNLYDMGGVDVHMGSMGQHGEMESHCSGPAGEMDLKSLTHNKQNGDAIEQLYLLGLALSSNYLPEAQSLASQSYKLAGLI
jgi:hypothetical protein